MTRTPALEAAVAVAAVGRPDQYPSGSMAASHHALARAEHDAGNGLVFARFSCYGAEIDCCGPGVGIVSTVPAPAGVTDACWAGMSGTSMASPAVCGALAVRLARSQAYLDLPRGPDRSEQALNELYTACRQNTLGPFYQGRGMPVL